MSNNVTVFVNGGNPLGDCPTNWDAAKSWIESANSGRDGEYPAWRFDCGFKLDFDGPVVGVFSRFYPPKTYYGSKWDGGITVYVGETSVLHKSLECETLDELKARLKPRKSNVSADMFDTANTYDDKVNIVRMLVDEDSSRVASLLKKMVAAKSKPT